MCQTTKILTPQNPESPANKGFHEPNNTKMYNSRYWLHLLELQYLLLFLVDNKLVLSDFYHTIYHLWIHSLYYFHLH